MQRSAIAAGSFPAVWDWPNLQSPVLPSKRPHITVILASSVDGKIATVDRTPAKFSSGNDLAHLERQIARADATLFGAGTLRAHQTTLSVRSPHLQAERKAAGKPTQPIQIVASRQGNCDRTWRFFQQPIPRWLLTTTTGARSWAIEPANTKYFERLLLADTGDGEIDWEHAFTELLTAGIERLAVLGGVQLVAALAALGAIDELWLTICPVLLGGATAPTPLDGEGLRDRLPLELLSAETHGAEVFLHYRCQKLEPTHKKPGYSGDR